MPRYKNVADRLDTTRYFYFPTESNIQDMNCFERSASLYIAFHELYNESNPSLIMITDKHKNVHATVIFTHNNKLWGADPSYGYFGEINLNHDSIVVPLEISDSKNLLSRIFSSTIPLTPQEINVPTKECKIPFEKINTITGKSLEYLVSNLRSQPGIVDFIYGSGQIMAQSLSGLVNKNLFMKITPEGNIVSDIRVNGESFSDKNACLRFKYNPLTKKQDMEFLRYSGYAWGTLPSPESDALHVPGKYEFGRDAVDEAPVDIFKEVIFYLQNIKQKISCEELKDFANHPVVQIRFKAIVQAAQKIDDATYLKTLHYLRCRFGPAKNLYRFNLKGIELTVKESDYLNNFGSKSENDSDLSIDEKLPLGAIHLNLLFEESVLVSVPPILKLFDDRKRYVEVAPKYVQEKGL
jgi:hypothetical protein